MKNALAAAALFLAIVGAQLIFGADALLDAPQLLSAGSQPVPVAQQAPAPHQFAGPMVQIDLSSDDPKVAALAHCLLNATADYPGNGYVRDDVAVVPGEIADGCSEVADVALVPAAGESTPEPTH